MLQNYNIWKVMRIFFDDPNPKEGFTLRGISREARLAPTSVKLYLETLSKKGKWGYPLVIKSKGRTFASYWPNRASELFRFYKKMDMIFRIEESGILDYLENSLSPGAITLFGSASRGEDLDGSDIDFFVMAGEKRLELKKFEVVLKRKISIHFANNISSLPKELKNNILNGIILRGYVKVF